MSNGNLFCLCWVGQLDVLIRLYNHVKNYGDLENYSRDIFARSRDIHENMLLFLDNTEN